ncbi:early protein E1 [Camelus dromedarius papillomavirus 3]|nr:early protein E1 [Camelus dromedarius papillomavirus 3]
MADGEGTSTGEGGGYFLDLEAACSESESTASSYIDADESESEGEDFIDNASVHSAQGNHLAVFQTLVKKAGDREVKKLKRKLILGSCEGSDAELGSPLLAPNSNTPPRRTPVVKRRLFGCRENTSPSPACSHEASGTSTPATQVPGRTGSGGGKGLPQVFLENKENLAEGSQLAVQLLQAKNSTACKMAHFKEAYTVSFLDLTRIFHSDKTTNNQWVVAGFGVSEAVFEASVERLQKHCSFVQASRRSRKKGTVTLFLLDFNVAKCRETVLKLFTDLLNLSVLQLLCQPPKIKGVCAALFWFKNAISSGTFSFGTVPRWIQAQTSLSESTADQTKFDFGVMVQWAWDHKYSEESVIAYQYALNAETDANAKAWLGCSNQARVVKDVAAMVRYYQRAAMLGLTMSAYLYQRCDLVQANGNWVNVMNVLKYQGISPISFVAAMKSWLQGIPKKNCIALIGPPNTGKSMFSNSLIGFLGGRVLSFANHHSHFWLAPLSETRAALIDDATYQCWKYFDIYLRSVLDGYPIQIDRKHRTPVQIKAPPLLVTSNVDVATEPQLQYLHSRVVVFYFKQPCPVDAVGEPLLQISHADWKSFFKRLWARLELSDQEDEGEDGGSAQTFKCNARGANADD